ncbi:MAG TPA: hypothetical protein PLD20_27400 [Blastocatellia bacterium]|nr:hypothetical protein [Blastocatellia bacterium]HMV87944.1 hypothetical protein [Blastocatellia bacterium]HMX27292.1 hypothetical protein [Blastocatellia bacterium]HMZ21689.1 hypothetical protein [Blastocatellia bacterium]HNG32958.1 hypothetical protein [Blastocatellia bacterium]
MEKENADADFTKNVMAGIQPAATALPKTRTALKIFSENDELPESTPDFLPEKVPNERAAFHNLRPFIKNLEQKKI